MVAHNVIVRYTHEMVEILEIPIADEIFKVPVDITFRELKTAFKYGSGFEYVIENESLGIRVPSPSITKSKNDFREKCMQMCRNDQEFYRKMVSLYRVPSSKEKD